MSLADRVEEARAKRAKPTARILTIDIERVPFQAWSYETRPDYIPWRMIGQPSRMICWAAKWYDSEDIVFRGEFDFHERRLTESARRRMLEEAWSLLDQADVVVGFNSRRFDTRHLATEFLLEGFGPPSTYKHVDLYQIAKREFIFESNSLDYVARRLGVGEKVATGYDQLWRGCMMGDREAWRLMRSYNKGDITVTEALYDRLRGWMPGHPHIARAEHGRPICNQCGSSELTRVGQHQAVVLRYSRFRCDDCGAIVAGTAVDRVATSRGVRPT